MKFKKQNKFSNFKNVKYFEAVHIPLYLPNFQHSVDITVAMIKELSESMQILEIEPYLELLFYKNKIDFNMYQVIVDAYVGFEHLSNKRYFTSITSKIDTSEEVYENLKDIALTHFYSELENIEHMVQIFFEEEIMKKALSDIYEAQVIDIPCSFTKKIMNKYLRISEALFSGKKPTEQMTLEEYLTLNTLIQKLVETNKCFPMFLYVDN